MRMTKKQQERLPLVQALFALGISYREVAEFAGVCEETVRNDIRLRANKKLFKNRPTKPRLIFQSAFKRYAELVVASKERALDPLEWDFCMALSRWLRVGEIRAFVQGVNLTMDYLLCPGCPSQMGYAKLLQALFNVRVDAVLNSESDRAISLLLAEEGWVDELAFIAEGNGIVPASREDLCRSFAMRSIEGGARRSKIMPIWDNEALAVVDSALEKLTPREAEVIRLRFGILPWSVPSHWPLPRSLDEAAQRLELSRERVRQIEIAARVKLRKPAFGLQLLIEPVGDALKQRLQMEKDEERQTLEANAVATRLRLLDQSVVVESGIIPLSLLLKPVEELDLTTRMANCLENRGTRLVGDLVQTTELELLKTKNFGRKSLLEIKKLLEPLGLRLGLRFSDELAQKYNAARGNGG